MASDRLYELAFAYRKTKLWEKMTDSQIFAVKLSDGRIGYLSVMGFGGEYRAVGLYIGEEGWNSLRTIAKADSYLIDELDYEEYCMSQRCLQCVFETKDEISKEAREEVLNYTRRHGMRLSGELPYPEFLKYQPYCVPWRIQTQEEEETLCEGLEAAIGLAAMLKEKTWQDLDLERLREDTREVLLLEKQDGGYLLGKTLLPEDKPEKWPEPKNGNEVSVAGLRKAKKRGTWECRILRMPEPVQDDPEEVPSFPVTFLAVETGSGFMVPVMPVKHYEENPDALLNQVLEAFVQFGVCPEKIKVADERSFVFAKVFCDKLGIALSKETELPELDDMAGELLADFDTEDDELMEEILGMLKKLPDGKLPEEITRQLGGLENTEGLSEFLQTLLASDGGEERLLSGKTGKPEGKAAGKARHKTAAKESYVISVSLGTGCYRHIRIAGSRTLCELHEAILDAFAFDDDHAYAFFMDNKVWSNRDSYYGERVETGGRTAERCRLSQLGLDKGRAFKYVFDFGDEWTFQCKVLRVTEGDAGETEIIKSKGDAPSQYDDREDFL